MKPTEIQTNLVGRRVRGHGLGHHHANESFGDDMRGEIVTVYLDEERNVAVEILTDAGPIRNSWANHCGSMWLMDEEG